MIEGTKFDWLPADVINHVILPYLEWDDKINLNRFLPASDRLRRCDRLKQEHVWEIVGGCALGIFSANRLRSAARIVDIRGRVRKFIRIVEDMKNPFILMMIKKGEHYRKTTEDKLDYFRLEENRMMIPSRSLAKKLVDVSNEVSAMIKRL